MPNQPKEAGNKYGLEVHLDLLSLQQQQEIEILKLKLELANRNIMARIFPVPLQGLRSEKTPKKE